VSAALGNRMTCTAGRAAGVVLRAELEKVKITGLHQTLMGQL
jgi:hypothetical protein